MPLLVPILKLQEALLDCPAALRESQGWGIAIPLDQVYQRLQFVLQGSQRQAPSGFLPRWIDCFEKEQPSRSVMQSSPRLRPASLLEGFGSSSQFTEEPARHCRAEGEAIRRQEEGSGLSTTFRPAGEHRHRLLERPSEICQNLLLVVGQEGTLVLTPASQLPPLTSQLWRSIP